MTSSTAKDTFFILCMAMLIRDFSDCCNHDEIVSGCRVEPSKSNYGKLECLCGIGCDFEFPFVNRLECEAKLEAGEATLDPCDSSPCQNFGQCIQVKYGRFRCECAGTNFYGERCQHACPDKMGPNAFGYKDSNYPLDCITI